MHLQFCIHPQQQLQQLLPLPPLLIQQQQQQLPQFVQEQQPPPLLTQQQQQQLPQFVQEQQPPPLTLLLNLIILVDTDLFQLKQVGHNCNIIVLYNVFVIHLFCRKSIAN